MVWRPSQSSGFLAGVLAHDSLEVLSVGSSDDGGRRSTSTPAVSSAGAGGQGGYCRCHVITDVHMSCGAELVAAKWSVSLNPPGNYLTNLSGKRLKDKRR